MPRYRPSSLTRTLVAQDRTSSESPTAVSSGLAAHKTLIVIAIGGIIALAAGAFISLRLLRLKTAKLPTPTEESVGGNSQKRRRQREVVSLQSSILLNFFPSPPPTYPTPVLSPATFRGSVGALTTSPPIPRYNIFDSQLSSAGVGCLANSLPSTSPITTHYAQYSPQRIASYSQQMRRQAQEKLVLSLSRSPLVTPGAPSLPLSVPAFSAGWGQPHNLQPAFTMVTPPAAASPPGDRHDATRILDANVDDYFSFKPIKYRAPFKDAPRSYFSPAITPAAPERLTRPTSPVLDAPPMTPPPPGLTPDEDPFRYVAYESTFRSHLRSPSIPDSKPRVSSPLAGPDVIQVKVHCEKRDELVKLRLRNRMSFTDVIETVKHRLPDGWDALYCADTDTEVEAIDSKLDVTELHRLSSDYDWRSWVDGSLSKNRRKLVLWAV